MVVPAAAANSSVALRWSHRGQSGEDRRRTGDAGLDVRGTGPTGAIRLDGKSKRNHGRLQAAGKRGTKCLKSLERVKGIEPSYSAWKAAALPLSYTRAGVDLTRRAGGLNPPRAVRNSLSKTALSPASPPGPGPLTGTDSPPILMSPSTMKGGDPVSYTKRCHLAGIAR